MARWAASACDPCATHRGGGDRALPAPSNPHCFALSLRPPPSFALCLCAWTWPFLALLCGPELRLLPRPTNPTSSHIDLPPPSTPPHCFTLSTKPVLPPHPPPISPTPSFYPVPPPIPSKPRRGAITPPRMHPGECTSAGRCGAGLGDWAAVADASLCQRRGRRRRYYPQHEKVLKHTAFYFPVYDGLGEFRGLAEFKEVDFKNLFDLLPLKHSMPNDYDIRQTKLASSSFIRIWVSVMSASYGCSEKAPVDSSCVARTCSFADASPLVRRAARQPVDPAAAAPTAAPFNWQQSCRASSASTSDAGRRRPPPPPPLTPLRQPRPSTGSSFVPSFVTSTAAPPSPLLPPPPAPPRRRPRSGSAAPAAPSTGTNSSRSLS
ncbi:Protein of unknown function [Gryllus bimaculatus]|nr:Protein of unknown function [Gryllus bimaculatus]